MSEVLQDLTRYDLYLNIYEINENIICLGNEFVCICNRIFFARSSSWACSKNAPHWKTTLWFLLLFLFFLCALLFLFFIILKGKESCLPHYDAGANNTVCRNAPRCQLLLISLRKLSQPLKFIEYCQLQWIK